MRENYGGNKKRREEAKRKWQEEKRNKKLNKKADSADSNAAGPSTPAPMTDPNRSPEPSEPSFPASDSAC